MTKQDLQKELKEKVREGVKPSDLKKIKRSKSADDISTSLAPNPPLPRSKSHLEIPVIQQPSLKQKVADLQDELTIERKRVGSLREDLASSQEKNKQSVQRISELEDKILELRVEKIKEFGDYLEQKGNLETELESNINTGIKEIQRLENQLKTVSKKKLELQSQLGQELSKNAQLESKLLDKEPPFNYWPIIATIALIGLTIWLFNKQ